MGPGNGREALTQPEDGSLPLQGNPKQNGSGRHDTLDALHPLPVLAPEMWDSLGGGGGYTVGGGFLCAGCSVFLRICTGVRRAVPLLTCTVPKDLVDDH